MQREEQVGHRLHHLPTGLAGGVEVEEEMEEEVVEEMVEEVVEDLVEEVEKESYKAEEERGSVILVPLRRLYY